MKKLSHIVVLTKQQRQKRDGVKRRLQYRLKFADWLLLKLKLGFYFVILCFLQVSVVFINLLSQGLMIVPPPLCRCPHRLDALPPSPLLPQKNRGASVVQVGMTLIPPPRRSVVLCFCFMLQFLCCTNTLFLVRSPPLHFQLSVTRTPDPPPHTLLCRA